MLSSLTVASSIISIITSYIIIDHNLIISLCLLVIFFMTFMLTSVLYLKPKVLVNQGGPSECANDDDQRGESQPGTPFPDTSSLEQSMGSLLEQHLLPRHQPQQQQYRHQHISSSSSFNIKLLIICLNLKDTHSWTEIYLSKTLSDNFICTYGAWRRQKFALHTPNTWTRMSIWSHERRTKRCLAHSLAHFTFHRRH